MADAGACFVCLEASPPPIQMGCTCRGDAGLAHIGCLIQAAASRAAHGSNAGWRKCSTCKQRFTGAMQHGLAEERWLRVRDQPAESEDRLDAESVLARSLCGQGKYAEAEQMLRELLDVMRRVLGPEHPGTLTTMDELGCSLCGQGKYAEAEQMFRELLGVKRRVLEPEHPHTLATMCNLAGSLSRLGKHAEAERMFRELLDAQRRVLGPEHRNTLATVKNLASLDSIRSVSASIVPSMSLSLIASRAVGSEGGVQTREQTTSAPPDPHPDAPPAKRARR